VRTLTGTILAIATAIVILAASVAPFLSPAWVGFEQGRADALAWTGYSEADLHAVTNSILGDLVLDTGDFGVTLHGSPVLNDRERSHMRDVRGVFAGFGLLALVSLAGLALAGRRMRGAEGRRRLWGAIRRGAQGLAVGVAVAAAVSLVAFDAAFELFHRLFFAQGTFDFDPRTDRLVQLFPDAFWSETTIALGAVAIVAAIAVRWIAGRREDAFAREAALARIDAPEPLTRPGGAELSPGERSPVRGTLR
jgi:integral membrane protein (TIGR01906 family)